MCMRTLYETIMAHYILSKYDSYYDKLLVFPTIWGFNEKVVIS